MQHGICSSFAELAEDETIESSGEVPNLCIEVIREIVKRCDTFKDFIACAGVSRLWRSACSEVDWNRGPQPPYLMLSETAQSDTRSFHSLLHRNADFELTLPAARGKRIWGSPHGWIVTLDDKLQVHLLNLISQIQLQLPPLPTIETLHLVGNDWFRRVHKSLTFKISATKLLVAVITHQPNNLFFARVPSKDGKSEDVEWITVHNPHNFIFRDVAYLEGQVYALCKNGSIVKIELNERSAAATDLLAGPNWETVDGGYLVISSDALFGIFRHGDYGQAVEFRVYKFDVEGNMWEEKEDIGGSVFFVCNGNSGGISSAASANCVENSIYFTDDNWEQEKSLYPFGVYYMDNWETHYLEMPPETDVDPRAQYSRPTWWVGV